MIEYRLYDMNIQRVIALENEIFCSYEKLVNKFKSDYEKYNCAVDLVKCWTVHGLPDALNSRPTDTSNYTYWICYQVLYNGKQIVYDDENSYIQRSYGVLTVSKKRHLLSDKKYLLARYFDDMSDVEQELTDDLHTVKRLLIG